MIKKSAIVMVLAAAAVVNAQGWVDSDGLEVLDLSPVFKYYPADGMVTVVNVGRDGVVNSADNGRRDGDDLGLISLLLSKATDPTTLEAALPPFADGVAWGAPVFFNGSIQLQGTAVTGQFLPVNVEETALFRIETDLGVADFLNMDGVVQIEVGNNDAAGAPGRTLFADIPEADIRMDGGAIIFDPLVIPEPSSFALLATALLAGLGLRRRS